MKRIGRIVFVALLLPAAAHAAVTVTGRMAAHPRLPGGSNDYAIPGQKVTVKITNWVVSTNSAGCDVCSRSGYAYSYPTTNSTGSYSATFSQSSVSSCSVDTRKSGHDCIYDPELHKPICFDYVCPASSGSGYTVYGYPNLGSEEASIAVASGSASSVALPTIVRAPHETFAKHWARRLGSGSNPVFIIEGFDPSNTMSSDYALAFLRLAKLNSSAMAGQQNIHDYLTANDFTIWLIQSGTNGKTSLAGSHDSAGNITSTTTGLAYDAMRLIKKIRDTWHPNHDIVVGGYSMGGLVARAGLNHWCRGDWATSGLPANCSEVALWFSADSPQQGANVPVAVQRYVQDSGVRSSLGTEQISLADGLVKSWPAKEQLAQWVQVDSGHSGCDTDCPDFGGCASSDSGFVANCTVRGYYDTTSPHRIFMNWAGGYSAPVTRSVGGSVPAIAFSMGKRWTSAGNLCYDDCMRRYNRCIAAGGGIYCGSCDSGDETREFLKVAVETARDHHLITNTAGGLNECDHGSKLSLLMVIDQDWGNSSWFPIDFSGHAQSANVLVFPTFVRSYSALAASSIHRWDAFYYEASNHNHSPVDMDAVLDGNPGPDDESVTIPSDGSGYLLAWIWEYLRGTKTVPVCHTVRKPYGYHRGFYDTADLTTACRSASCGDGVCEAGEKCVCMQDCGMCASL
jgi:hypothetical protein